MDVSFVIRQRLEELGLEQKDLARAAQVTESYISQLLTRKKAPPAPERTDIYDRMDHLLKLPAGELARVADAQRKGQLKRELEGSAPLFHEVRALILRKCNPGKEPEIRAVFEKQPFGELERLVTQKLLDVAKRIANAELQNDHWLRMVAKLGALSFEEMRVMVLEFLDTDIFHLSEDHCVSFLDPLIASWDVDLCDVPTRDRVEPAGDCRARAAIRVRRARASTAVRRAGVSGVRPGHLPERRRDREGAGVSQGPELRRPSPDCALLLPRAAEHQGSAALPAVIGGTSTDLPGGARAFRPRREG